MPELLSLYQHKLREQQATQRAGRAATAHRRTRHRGRRAGPVQERELAPPTPLEPARRRARRPLPKIELCRRLSLPPEHSEAPL